MKKWLAVALAVMLGSVGTVALTACKKSDGDGSIINKAVAREAASGTREVFEEKIIKGGVSLKTFYQDGTRVYPHAVQELNSTNGVFMEVKARYDTIGYVSLGSLLENTQEIDAVAVEGVLPTAQTVQSGEYPIYRYFNLVYRQTTYEENDLMQNFISYIESAEGQELIAREYVTLPAIIVREYCHYAGTQRALTVGGSTSVGPVIKGIADAFMKKNPSVSVAVEENGSGTGIQKALDGDYQIALSSRELKEEEKRVLAARAIALDGVAVVVKKGSVLKNVSLAQLFDLYTALTPIQTVT